MYAPSDKKRLKFSLGFSIVGYYELARKVLKKTIK